MPSPAVLELPSRWSRAADTNEPITSREWRVTLTDLAAVGTRQVVVYCADFFARPDALALLSIATALGMETAVFTDIAVTTPDFVGALTPLKCTGLWLTLYGARRETHDAVAGAGSFDRTMETARALHAQHQPVRLNASLSRWDSSALADLVELASGTQCPISTDVLRAPQPGTDGALARPAVWVIPDGAVRACRALGTVVGSLRSDSIADLWQQSEELRALAGTRVSPSPGCQQCQVRADCFHERPGDRASV